MSSVEEEVSQVSEKLQKRLCRFGLSGIPPILVETNIVREEDWYETTLAEFEKSLEGGLGENFYYLDRDDFAWLSCRRPAFPVESILGLEEEIEMPASNRKINIRTFEPVEKNDDGDNHNSVYTCHNDAIPPHSWTRSDDNFRTNNTQSFAQYNPRTITLLEWYDLQSLPQFQLDTQASCAHFLRSLLDARHDSSPWVTTNAQNFDKHVVVLVVDREVLTKSCLLDFRVSDVCPSWFLHAVGDLKITYQTLPWLGHNQNPSVPQAPSQTLVDSTQQQPRMLIYRRLPPRDGLTHEHPKTGEPAPFPGCLWETSVVFPKSSDDSMDSPAPFVQTVLLAPPILDPYSEYPNLLEPLMQSSVLDVLKQEAGQIAHWTAWPEQQHYKAIGETGEAAWSVFPLCHCFPAHDLSKRQWLPATCAMVPNTVRFLQTYLGDFLRTALFSRLDPNTVLQAHTGWDDLANHVLRIHIPLTVPPGDLCGVWVDGCVEVHQRGKALCFDDSKTHRAFNYSSLPRIVLIVDLARPSNMPLGSATGGHTDELDKFIEKMGLRAS